MRTAKRGCRGPLALLILASGPTICVHLRLSAPPCSDANSCTGGLAILSFENPKNRLDCGRLVARLKCQGTPVEGLVVPDDPDGINSVKKALGSGEYIFFESWQFDGRLNHLVQMLDL